MAGLAKKQGTVQALQETLKEAQVAVVVNYSGLTVAEVTRLRRELRNDQAQFSVVKNTLMKRAIADTPVAVLSDNLKGPSAILFGMSDQVAPIKTYTRVLKELKKDKVNTFQAGYMDGQLLSRTEVEQLASLPPLNELRAKLLGGIASPMNGLVASIIGPHRALVSVLDQLAQKKQG
jgi:large subunit ribosomal protein L10